MDPEFGQNDVMPNLWQQAYDNLIESDKDDLGDISTGAPFSPSEVIEAVEVKRIECEKKQWHYTNKSGENILVRDILNKLCAWLEKFERMGDTAAQLAPAYAAIPWIVVKLLIQTTISDCQIYGAMAESLEVIARIITRYTELEIRVLFRTSQMTKLLSISLVKLYGFTLRFLARARQYYGKGTLRRVLASAVTTVKSSIEEPMFQIERQEEEVYKLVRLVQDECIGAKLEDIINGIKQNVDKFHASDEERNKRFCAWINGIDTKNTYENVLRSRHVGTCEWVLKLPEFSTWEAAEPIEARLLWIHGPPGFGKTFLSASIIQYLEEKRNQAPLCYFFCVADNQPTRDPYAILRSWLMQMLGQSGPVLPVMEAVYKARNKEQTLTHRGLWELFVALGNAIGGCTFVIDGFDESVDIDMGAGYHSNDPRCFFLRDLLENLAKTKSRVLVVSRDVSDIREYLGQETAQSGVKKLEYEITSKDTTPDVRSFSEFMVNNKLPKKKEDLRQRIAMQAAERSEGMFLWIKLLEQEISPGQNAKQLSKTVLEMPSGIGEAYSREVKRIGQLPQEEKDEAVMILRWILFAVRPLQIKQLAEALVVSVDTLEDYPEDDLPDTWEDGFVDEDYVNEMILGRCGSLVQLRSSSEETKLADQTVHFVHFSVKEYLSSLSNATGSDQWAADLGLANPAAEEVRLSRICLRYLTLNTFEDIPPNTDLYPFLSYAAWAWYFHSFHEKPTPSQDIMHQTQRAFNPASSSWKVWTPLMEATVTDWNMKQWASGDSADENNSDGGLRPQKILNPIYYASLLGLSEVMQWLEDQGLDCTCVGGRFGFPLQAAVARRHVDVVKHLLDRGVDVLQRGGQHGASIIAAASVSTLEIVKILLLAKADVNVKDRGGRTALIHATARGEVDIIQCLLEHNADPNIPDNQGWTALHSASIMSNVEIVDLLLAYRADPNPAGAGGSTALHLATKKGTVSIVRSLLKHNADPNSLDKQNWTPLHSAARRDIDITRALLDAGAKVSGSDDAIYTPLQMAVDANMLPIVKLLHEYGADLDKTTRKRLNALILGVHNSNKPVVELLLDLGASMVWIAEETQKTLFDYVTDNGRDIEVLLIRRGCFRTKGEQRGIAEQEASHVKDDFALLAYKGELKELENYLKEAEGNLSNHDFGEALRIASTKGHLAVVNLLVRTGVPVDLCDINGRTALHHAVRHLHFDVADLLVEGGANVVMEDDIGSTPIDVAVAHGKKAFEFIQKHMNSFTIKINRRQSLLNDSSTPSSNISMLAARKNITGLWTGDINYLAWFEGRKDPFSFIIHPASPRGPFTFSNDGMDRAGKFQFIGFTDPIGLVWFVKLYEAHGWLYRGTLDSERKTLKGTWGRNRKLWFGTFEATHKDLP